MHFQYYSLKQLFLFPTCLSLQISICSFTNRDGARMKAKHTVMSWLEMYPFAHLQIWVGSYKSKAQGNVPAFKCDSHTWESFRNPARVTERPLACSPSPAYRFRGVRTNIILAKLILVLRVGFPPLDCTTLGGTFFSLSTIVPSAMQMNNMCLTGQGIICLYFQKVLRKPVKMLIIWRWGKCDTTWLKEGKARRDNVSFPGWKIYNVQRWSQGRHVFRWQAALRVSGAAKWRGWRTRVELECGKYKRENYPNPIDTRGAWGHAVVGSQYLRAEFWQNGSNPELSLVGENEQWHSKVGDHSPPAGPWAHADPCHGHVRSELPHLEGITQGLGRDHWPASGEPANSARLVLFEVLGKALSKSPLGLAYPLIPHAFIETLRNIQVNK